MKNLAHGWATLSVSLFTLLSGCGRADSPATSSFPAWAASRQFTSGGRAYSPADITRMELSLNFDVATAQAYGEGTLEFRATGDGYAYFLSDPRLEETFFEGAPGTPVALNSVRDPSNENTLRVINAPMEAGTSQRLHFRYRMPAEEVTFRAQGVGFVTSMGDLSRGNFLEAYAPTGFEDDAYSLSLRLAVLNAGVDHQFFANGEITTEGRNAWHVDFPDYFSVSSFYWHVTDQNLPTTSFVYQAINGPIPITVYSATQAKVDEAVRQLPGLFDELETTYGPYTHNKFVAYISGAGGMEHAGATITGIDSLDHELLHSWFARGVVPADGRSGWIDEAIASWRDYGYRRSGSLLARKPTNLGRFSAFHRFTPRNCYTDGRAFLAELDAFVADQGGLKPLLKEFYRRYQRKAVRTRVWRGCEFWRG
ncbi:MAG: hypothetical protein EOP11_08140 [Proteobacteria bacterium]|nr:MAG: hypothetical protein EOP11_08140 [Pseudomonadota bacterium]